ncbi:pentapeptide repeat-containing protein [Actinoallomurus sp. WRP9H-5]|nr:pentapeptide repeat-containing protein [Actinoallomurus rhizosphaericola]
MTDGYGRSRADVRIFPRDPEAREALETYLDALPADPQIVIPSFAGNGLDFSGADLSGLELLGAYLDEAIMDGVKLVGARLGSASLVGTRLRKADLSHTSLRKAEARSSDLRDALLLEADLQSSSFEDADMRGADLRNAKLNNAWLVGADLRDADLRQCAFGGHDSWTGMPEVRMAGARLDGGAGRVEGPIDVGTTSPHLLDGEDLERWFADRGAPQVEVRRSEGGRVGGSL